MLLELSSSLLHICFGRNLRIFMTFSTLVYIFSKAWNSFVIFMNLANILPIDSKYLMMNIMHKDSDLDSLTWLVSLWVVNKCLYELFLRVFIYIFGRFKWGDHIILFSINAQCKYHIVLASNYVFILSTSSHS